ncbi:MAG: hypothetical protein KDK11_04785 [Maritimibacter sp.]|nr:hypothetical protein [Maritimibacter sp.]
MLCKADFEELFPELFPPKPEPPPLRMPEPLYADNGIARREDDDSLPLAAQRRRRAAATGSPDGAQDLADLARA